MHKCYVLKSSQLIYYYASVSQANWLNITLQLVISSSPIGTDQNLNPGCQQHQRQMTSQLSYSSPPLQWPVFVMCVYVWGGGGGSFTGVIFCQNFNSESIFLGEIEIQDIFMHYRKGRVWTKCLYCTKIFNLVFQFTQKQIGSDQNKCTPAPHNIKWLVPKNVLACKNKM